VRLFGRWKGCSRTVTETGCAALAEAAREDLPWCEIVHSYSHDSPRELKVAGDAAGAVSLPSWSRSHCRTALSVTSSAIGRVYQSPDMLTTGPVWANRTP
jgi:hypothetical protein